MRMWFGIFTHEYVILCAVMIYRIWV